MTPKNYVVFKGTKDGITLQFDPDASFVDICEQLTRKVKEASSFFDNVKTALAFKGRSFTEEQEQELMRIVVDNTTMDITFVKTESSQLMQLAALAKKEAIGQNVTKYHKGSLRNGQRIDFDGSVVVIGDVNPGAEIKATGNIIILGQLKGMAHAGCEGIEEAFVCALYMAPVQLRIADIITRFPEENKRGNKAPEFAFIQEGQIFVMPLS
ncbi:septum site-determining protein MinC [Chakrabartyella piscis]|uniref:septum site-determining protein MinC n=1 Tax=Chakrabartyella piscis TaxID=2918914 RepID=UPI002958D36C|nr:septum site-determining protein MinC [Chakrabartyella piscis]